MLLALTLTYRPPHVLCSHNHYICSRTWWWSEKAWDSVLYKGSREWSRFSLYALKKLSFMSELPRFSHEYSSTDRTCAANLRAHASDQEGMNHIQWYASLQEFNRDRPRAGVGKEHTVASLLCFRSFANLRFKISMVCSPQNSQRKRALR